MLVLILALGVFLPMWDLATVARGGEMRCARERRGFSLLELLIVIVIVSVLLVVAIDRLLRAALRGRARHGADA